tara:strand:- start:123 stop:284 length:162 start_codon:yes stop_codon:yes gene_type:complete
MKYDVHDHITLLSEINILLQLRNETQEKINVKNKELEKINKAKEKEEKEEVPF